jgi:hypothetical protein
MDIPPKVENDMHPFIAGLIKHIEDDESIISYIPEHLVAAIKKTINENRSLKKAKIKTEKEFKEWIYKIGNKIKIGELKMYFACKILLKSYRDYIKTENASSKPKPKL